MTREGPPDFEADDYRHSHLSKGADYDKNIWSGGFNTYMAEQERRIVERLVKRLFAEGIPRYLDFACGTGRITEWMELLAETSYGVDVSKKMVAEARKKCSRTTFLLQDPTREPLDIDPVQLVTAFRFFGNAQDELRRSVLRAVHDVLVPGGYLLLNNHRNASSVRQLLLAAKGERHSLDLSHGKLRKLLAAEGFTVVRTYGIGFWLMLARFNRPDVLNSRLVRWIEPLSRFGLLARFCPDLVLVARKND